MANISTYPIGTPAQGDLIPGTQKYTDANGKTENLTKNFTVAQLAAFANSYSLGYTIYTATISAAGALVEPKDILQNTTGGTITWSKVSTGSYKGIISGATFTSGKTIAFLSSIDSSKNLALFRKTDTQINLEQRNLSNALVDDFSNLPIEIRIYS